MNKGFTLIEVMATIVILAIVLIIAVPVYNGVRDRINENIYESKIQEVLAKAESYASENHAFVFDIKTLIEDGKISADNETGVYIDPRTGRDMRCDVINALYKENRYEVSITESEICYRLEELENLYGMVNLKLYNQEDKEIEKLSDTEWIKEGYVKVRYEFKEEYKEYEEHIEHVEWIGECDAANSNESVCVITTNEIKNATVSLELTINMDGVEIKNQVQKNILIDLQRPSVIDGSVNVNNELSTNNERRVEFEISDGSGSGIKSYSIVKEKSCSGKEYEENKQIASDGVQSIYLGNGDYYICVEDKVGNKTSNEDLENSKNQIHVENVDNTKLQIQLNNSSNGVWTKNNVTLTLTTSKDNVDFCMYRFDNGLYQKYNGSIDNRTLKVTYTDNQNRVVTWQCVDKAGNVSNEISTSIKIDKVAPTITFSETNVNKGENGWYKTISVVGNVNETGSGVKSVTYCTGTNNCTPSKSISLSNNKMTIGIANQTNQKVCVTVQDTVGNSSTSCSSSYNVDNVNPTAKISVSANGSTVKVSASGSSDNLSGVRTYYYKIDNGGWQSSTSNVYNFTKIADGSHTVYVKVKDAAGNTSGEVNAKVTVSTGPVSGELDGNVLHLKVDYTFKSVHIKDSYTISYIFTSLGLQGKLHRNRNNYQVYLDCKENDNDHCTKFYLSTSPEIFSEGSIDETFNEPVIQDYFYYYTLGGRELTATERVEVADSIHITGTVSLASSCRNCTTDVRVQLNIDIVNPKTLLVSNPESSYRDPSGFRDPTTFAITGFSMGVHSHASDGEGGDNCRFYGPITLDMSNYIKEAMNR